MPAAIDIGTNSVLLLLGEVGADGRVEVKIDCAEGTRLGQGLSSTGRISDEAAERTLAVLREYRRLCDEQGAGEIAVVGTEALRRAENARSFVSLVKDQVGFDVEIISKEREAELTYAASERDFGSDIVVLDIGGGSTELIAKNADSKLVTLSMPIGCVTLLENFVESDPVTGAELSSVRLRIREVLEESVEPRIFARPNDRTLIATAGTATTLKAMDVELEPYRADAVHGKPISIARLRDIIDELMKKTIPQRREMKGLPSQRADVILTGAALLHEAMSYLGFARATISDRGVRWGLFYEKFC